MLTKLFHIMVVVQLQEYGTVCFTRGSGRSWSQIVDYQRDSARYGIGSVNANYRSLRK
jgi:hypothetical protein